MSRLDPPAKRMLTPQEAAEYCGFSAVKRFTAHARVAPVNYGNTVRYDRDRLDEWLDTLSQSEDQTGLDIVEAAGNENSRDRRSRVS